MVAKVVLFVCAQALFVQFIYGQCIGTDLIAPVASPWAAGWGVGWGAGAWGATPWGAGPWAVGPWGNGPWAAPFAGPPLTPLTPASAAASRGGALPVTSASAIPPTGVSVTSENAYAGELAVTGALPFLGTVTFEGALPTIGAGAITYGCGNGVVTMVAEDMGVARVARPLVIDAAVGPIGCRADLLDYTALGAPFGGCGCVV